MRGCSKRWRSSLAAAVMAACGSHPGGSGDGAAGDASADGGDAAPTGITLTHDFPAFELDAGQEIATQCQSWTLNNEQPLFVHRVHAKNDGGWHHSNWLFVRDSAFDGPDGTWPCEDRGYNELAAGILGGVIFAQSTQASEEEQLFPEGTAVRLPPFARIVGAVHLLNATGEDIDSTHLGMEIETIAEEDVVTQLHPMSFSYTTFSIPPHTVSSYSMDCDIREAYEDAAGEAPDFKFYYALPHYHALASLLDLTLVGGENDGTKILESNGAVGEPWGVSLEPAIDFGGAEAIRLRCIFNNTRDEYVRWGISDQEMCLFLAYTDTEIRLVAGSGPTHATGEENEVLTNEAGCTVMGLPPI